MNLSLQESRFINLHASAIRTDQWTSAARPCSLSLQAPCGENSEEEIEWMGIIADRLETRSGAPRLLTWALARTERENHSVLSFLAKFSRELKSSGGVFSECLSCAPSLWLQASPRQILVDLAPLRALASASDEACEEATHLERVLLNSAFSQNDVLGFEQGTTQFSPFTQVERKSAHFKMRESVSALGLGRDIPPLSPHLKIRRAEPSDALTLYSFLRECFETDPDFEILKFTEWERFFGLNGKVSNEEDFDSLGWEPRFFILYERTHPRKWIGVVSLRIEHTAQPSSSKQFAEVFIESFCIAPQHRYQGYGDQLVQFCKTIAKSSLGASRLALTVSQSNEPALRLYEKHGFEKIEERTTLLISL